jgi:hypothetical protein
VGAGREEAAALSLPRQSPGSDAVVLPRQRGGSHGGAALAGEKGRRERMCGRSRVKKTSGTYSSWLVRMAMGAGAGEPSPSPER